MTEFIEAVDTELRRFARSRVPSDLVDDLMGDAYVVLVEKWLELPSATSARRAMAFGIVKMLARRVGDARARRYRLHQRLAASQVEDLSHCPQNDLDSADEVERMLSLVAPRYAQVLRMSDIDGMSNQEIAAILDLTPENTRVRLHRAHKALRTAIENERAHPAPATERRRHDARTT